MSDPVPPDAPEPEPLDLSEWEAQAPPVDFAERVLAKVRADEGPRETARAGKPGSSPTRSRRFGLVTAGVTLAAIAAAMMLRLTSVETSGELVAAERTEASLGARARGVLEPGAHVSWKGDDVTQSSGDVFYRVEPGARFRVHTPAGEVEVKGTCFTVKVRARGEQTRETEDMQKRDVKVGTVGALASAMVFVGVYEGKVAVSHASERLELRAGESATVGPEGVKKGGAPGEAEKAFEAKAQAAESDDPLAKANQNLVTQVSEYRSRLETIASQKADLEAKLRTSEAKLAAQADGAAPRARSEWDLDRDDWTALAKNGEVKYRIPCAKTTGWSFTPERLNKLGLAPNDAPAIREAYERTNRVTWEKIKPLCAQALGASPDIVEKIGLATCPHLIYDIALASETEATREAHTQAAEIRAGLRPEPGPSDKVSPVTRMFLLLTAENKVFEGELAKSFGPEEAHRLAYSDEMCTSNSRWGGGVKRDKGDK